MKVLICYATTEGQTRKIARFCAGRLVDAGHSVELLPAAEAGAPDAAGHDGAILAGSVHLGTLQPELAAFARAAAPSLNAMPTLLLQVSLAAHPDIVVLAVCGDGLTALSQLAQEPPRLLIIDSNLLDDEIEALIGTVKVRWPAIHCLALLQLSQREKQLMAVGADATIHRDSWLQDFPVVLVRLMQNAEEPGNEESW